MANRSHVIIIEKGRPVAKFYCGDEVRLRDPETGQWSGTFWVARVKMAEETNTFEYDVNSKDQVLIHTGVKEPDLKDA